MMLRIASVYDKLAKRAEERHCDTNLTGALRSAPAQPADFDGEKRHKQPV
jgi:hypothetical protein